MTENITIDTINKKDWNPPDVFQLDFRKTLDGESPGNKEDTYDNAPTSGTN